LAEASAIGSANSATMVSAVMSLILMVFLLGIETMDGVLFQVLGCCTGIFAATRAWCQAPKV
jgi:hypothetical protein